MIEPITLGGGKALFPTDGEARQCLLISLRPRPPAYWPAATRPSSETLAVSGIARHTLDGRAERRLDRDRRAGTDGERRPAAADAVLIRQVDRSADYFAQSWGGEGSTGGDYAR